MRLRSQSLSSECAGLPGAAPQDQPHIGLAGRLLAAFQALRPHQCVKNVLVFVPLLAGHRLGQLHLIGAAALAFAAFSLCAASVYVINDLMDAPADRTHPHKRSRPIASGRLPRGWAFTMVPLLAAASLGLGALLDARVNAVLATYFAAMLAYTLRLRAVVLLDALVLAVGYALRVAAGAFAVDVLPSSWLLVFCVFLFFSLALIKRYAELIMMAREGIGQPHVGPRARGYLPEDQVFVLVLGVSAATLAVLVLALYLGAAPASAHHRGGFIWVVCVLLLYWLSHAWLIAHRGLMSDDPVIFALKDRVSQVLTVLMGAAAWLAI